MLFVYNPGREDHARFLDSLHSSFVDQHGLRDTQCVVFCHFKPGSKGRPADLCELSYCKISYYHNYKVSQNCIRFCVNITKNSVRLVDTLFTGIITCFYK